jgi:enoyl-CoA hydratase/carnithine racemase
MLRGGDARSIAEGLVAESTTYSMLQSGPEHRAWLAHRDQTRGRRHRPPTSSADAVLIARDGDALHLTLHRPAVHNAFDASMREALLDGLAVAQADPRVRVVIDGTGPSFCSGGDLDEFGTLADPVSAHLIRLGRSVGRALAALADRVTFHVHGACAGAGVELPAFSRQVIAAPDARFWLPELSMGLVPGAGGTVSLPRRIGRQRTARLALLGTPIDAITALDWGLVDQLG